MKGENVYGQKCLMNTNYRYVKVRYCLWANMFKCDKGCGQKCLGENLFGGENVDGKSAWCKNYKVQSVRTPCDHTNLKKCSDLVFLEG